MSGRPSNRLGKRLHVGIFGPSLSGKTNVAKFLMVNYWRNFGIRSIVCDKNVNQAWPACALVFRDPEKFWPFVWQKRGCAIFADEGGSSVKRNREATEYFTSGRQNDHVLHVLGHHISNLLPEMRDQLHTLFLFTQTTASASAWAEEWADDRLLGAIGLPQYEFLWAEKYGDKRTRKNAVTHGIFPIFT